MELKLTHMYWPNHLQVSRHSSPHPSSRSGALYLFKDARKRFFWGKLLGGKFLFDFRGVEFVSRSYTDQFLNEMAKWEQEGMQVILRNQSAMVQEMFETVAANKKRKSERAYEISYHRVETMEELAEYLGTI
ncbi:MAG: hypothetical protein AAF804_10455 [Bacteroidota bacterium]